MKQKILLQTSFDLESDGAAVHLTWAGYFQAGAIQLSLYCSQ